MVRDCMHTLKAGRLRLGNKSKILMSVEMRCNFYRMRVTMLVAKGDEAGLMTGCG
jgi:hypothetical protein